MKVSLVCKTQIANVKYVVTSVQNIVLKYSDIWQLYFKKNVCF